MTDITALSRELYDNARDKGFYDHEDRLRQQVELAGETAHKLGVPVGPHAEFVRTQLAEHFGNRLMLIAGEAIEAHEEVRGGHGVAELYFRGKSDRGEYLWSEPVAPITGELLKPEGVLAELADVAIRTVETMQSILDQASPAEAEKLREQVPDIVEERYTTGRLYDNGEPAYDSRVTVAEIILLKHRFNLSRAPKHGGKAF